jgi:hypothetical protein
MVRTTRICADCRAPITTLGTYETDDDSYVDEECWKRRKARLLLADELATLAQVAAERDAALGEVETFRTWAQKLLDVSEYVGTDREDASRWQCAFGCGGYSYENVNGTAENDGGYKRTPPASRDWHTLTCRVRALAADLGLTSERPS